MRLDLVIEAMDWLESNPQHFDMSQWVKARENYGYLHCSFVSTFRDILHKEKVYTCCLAGAIVKIALEKGLVAEGNSSYIPNLATSLVQEDDMPRAAKRALMDIFRGNCWHVKLDQVTIDMLSAEVDNFLALCCE